MASIQNARVLIEGVRTLATLLTDEEVSKIAEVLASATERILSDTESSKVEQEKK